jgi:hypothetical protein
MEARFPPPWSAEVTPNCFIVRDADGQQLAYVYFEDEPGRRSAAKLLIKDEARRIAVNIAKLPELRNGRGGRRVLANRWDRQGASRWSSPWPRSPQSPPAQDRGHTRLMGGLHHVARETNFEAKESDESRNGIGSRRGVVAGGRRVRGSRWSARRYTAGERGNYSR